MRRIYDVLSATKADKPARRFLLPLVLTALILLPLIAAAVISFSDATPGVSAQQSTAEVCRETVRVIEQYEREFKEVKKLIIFKDSENKWRGRLSELRRAIANGFVVTDLKWLAEQLELSYPGASTKERLAFQKTVRDVVEKKLVQVRDLNRDELRTQYARIEMQLDTRSRRMFDLNCAQVLARQETSTSGGKHLGCFKDTNNPFDLDGFLQRSQNNTPEACIATCRAKGFKYAGVQYGESCLCGNSYGKSGTASNCDMKCTGDGSKICGGRYSNSVYETGLP